MILLVLCAPQKTEVNGWQRPFTLLISYDPANMAELTRLIEQKVKVPRAKLERRFGWRPVLRIVAVGESRIGSAP